MQMPLRVKFVFIAMLPSVEGNGDGHVVRQSRMDNTGMKGKVVIGEVYEYPVFPSVSVYFRNLLIGGEGKQVEPVILPSTNHTEVIQTENNAGILLIVEQTGGHVQSIWT